jgi:hypothetical protein
MCAAIQDNDIPLTAIKPPFKGVRQNEINRIASELLFPLNVTNDRQYYLSIHAGQLLDRQVWLRYWAALLWRLAACDGQAWRQVPCHAAIRRPSSPPLMTSA